MAQQFNFKNIRALLTEGFADEELRRLCYDNPEFRPVYERLGQGMGKDEVIDRLIEYADRQELLETLLELTKKLNSTRYEIHKPYYDVIIEPTAPVDTLQKSRTAKFFGKNKLFFVGILAVAGIIGSMIYNTILGKSEPVAFPTCQVSDTPVHVGVAQLPNCSIDFQQQLADGLMTETSVISSLNWEFESSDAARVQSGFDIVVWGMCTEGDEKAQLRYELTTTRKPDEIYEPPNLTLAGTLSELTEVGLALISYQQGDYDKAVERFSQLPSTEVEPNQAMMWANSLLFAGQYDPAIDAYEDTVLKLIPNWSAAHNNLGVVRFNKELLDIEGVPQAGRDSFDRAIKLATDHHEIDLAILAQVNKSKLLLQARSWRDAKASCEAALSLDTHSAPPYICRASYNFFRGFTGMEDMQLSAIEDDLNQARQFGDFPAILYYLQATLYEQQNQKRSAINAYEQFFAAMKYRACLQTDKETLKQATVFINELLRNNP